MSKTIDLLARDLAKIQRQRALVKSSIISEVVKQRMLAELDVQEKALGFDPDSLPAKASKAP